MHMASADKEPAYSVEDLGSIPKLRISPGGGVWQPTPVFLPVDKFQFIKNCKTNLYHVPNQSKINLHV